MKALLDPHEVADELRVPYSTLAYWRHIGKGPRWAKVGRRVVYRREDVVAWIGEQFDKPPVSA